MKRLSTVVLAISALAAGAAWAHGDDKPRHGGVVQMSGEVKLELVAQPDAAVVYVDDHDETIPAGKLSGKLTVLGAGGKTEAKLEPVADDKLVAKGVKLSKGDKVIALVTMDNKQTSSARFVVK